MINVIYTLIKKKKCFLIFLHNHNQTIVKARCKFTYAIRVLSWSRQRQAPSSRWRLTSQRSLFRGRKLRSTTRPRRRFSWGRWMHRDGRRRSACACRALSCERGRVGSTALRRRRGSHRARYLAPDAWRMEHPSRGKYRSLLRVRWRKRRGGREGIGSRAPAIEMRVACSPPPLPSSPPAPTLAHVNCRGQPSIVCFCDASLPDALLVICARLSRPYVRRRTFIGWYWRTCMHVYVCARVRRSEWLPIEREGAYRRECRMHVKARHGRKYRRSLPNERTRMREWFVVDKTSVPWGII